MIPIYIMADSQPFRLDYLVIAGGGGGRPNIYAGGGSGGGGGAGGYISGVQGEQSGGPSSVLDQIVLYGGESILISIGAGGSSNTSGENTTFHNLTAIGGGYGNNSDADSADGGSGGGSSGFDGFTFGSGTTNQGNNGGPGGPGGNLPATLETGGGGGAGEAGNTDGGSQGGDGIASSITGLSTYYAGGGGGTNAPSSSAIAGGLGGGGTGRAGDLRFTPLSPATSGLINTGGGGGGGGGSGGSGVVILRYPSLARIVDYIDPGLTYNYSDDGTWKRYKFTSGSGNIRF